MKRYAGESIWMKRDWIFYAGLAVFSAFLLIAAVWVAGSGNNSNVVNVKEENGPQEETIVQEAETATEEETKVPGYLSDAYVNRDERIVICIDPGHGGTDTGAAKNGYQEKEQTLELCLLIREYLLQYDVEVVMTRETDVEISKNDRVFIANENYADVLVSIHRNNFAYSSAHGFEIWIGLANKEEDRRLAQLIMDNIAMVEGTYIRGIETGSTTDRSEDYIVNRHSLMPSCLVEMGFISNKADNALFEDNKEEYARLIAEAILTYLDIDLGDKKNNE